MRRILTAAFAAAICTDCLSAIVTERNDWFIVPAPAVNFVGSPSHPGIESQWIPYGTYTNGTGGTEYTRVTSNLYGVVYSVWDGYFERDYAWMGGWLEQNQDSNRMSMVTSSGKTLYGCTDTLRIMDWLNIGTYGQHNLFEYGLARTSEYDPWWDSPECHDGVAAQYGGRTLESLLTSAGYSIEPPIGTNWFSTIPFKAADSNLWSKVWPAYSMLTNDLHFFPTFSNKRAYYINIDSWIYSWYESRDEEGWGLSDVWGEDVIGVDEWGYLTNPNGGRALMDACETIPLPYNMEDVLSVDTGWKYETSPVETSSYWTVSGPLGSFHMPLRYERSEGGMTEKCWFGYNEEGTHDAEIWVFPNYTPGRMDMSFSIFDVTQPGVPTVYVAEDQPYSDADQVTFTDGNTSYDGYITRLRRAGVDDYAHWSNSTVRLDWKRLGILCQLERQMEISYYAATSEERLPFKSVSAERSKHGSATIHVTIPAPVHADDTNLVILAGTDWHLEDRAPSISTNDIGWCYPTCRTPIPLFNYGTATLGVRSPLAVGWDDFTNRVYQSINQSKVEAGSSYWAVFEFSLEAFAPTPGSLFAKVEFTPHYIDEDCISGLQGYQWPLQGFDADIEVVCDMGKSVIAYYTTARAEQSSAIKERFEAFPPVSAWNHGYVSRQRRPTLDVMISGTDSKSHADSTNTVPLKWSKEETLMDRFFRMNPLCAETASRTASDNNRLEMLRDLDAEVKNKCVALGGIDVNILTNVANISAAEATEMVRRINGAGLPLSLGLAKSWGKDGYAVVAINFGLKEDRSFDYIQIWAETGESSTELPPGEAIQFGTYGWSGANRNPGYETPIGSYKDVRVDGHQNQMIKTLWKFKNLRDPNL